MQINYREFLKINKLHKGCGNSVIPHPQKAFRDGFLWCFPQLFLLSTSQLSRDARLKAPGVPLCPANWQDGFTEGIPKVRYNGFPARSTLRRKAHP